MRTENIADFTLQVVEYGEERVLTTEQLAQVYECEPNNIKKNFNANKERFILGKHYFQVDGDKLKELRVTFSDLQISPMTRSLYLWTRRGAARHCKMLGTEKAWEMFDALEEKYFTVEPKKLTLAEEMARGLLAAQALIEQKDREIKELSIANTEMKPKAAFYDDVTGSEDTIDIKSVAKVLHIPKMGRNKLFAFLRDKNILNKRNEPYQYFVDKGYFRQVESSWELDGTIHISLKTVVFQKGVEFIKNLLSKEGITPVEG